ncbi:MAG: protein kinase [Bacteroides sp.]|nr:protein kinase [Bacteroides sp.]
MFKLEDTSGFDIKDLDTYDKNYHVVRVVHESRSGFCRILEVRYSGRIFIAKTLKPEYRGSQPHKQLLTKEYEILSSLYHPSIIQTFGIVEIEGEGPALLLEYAYGVTLDDYLTERKRDAVKMRLILEQICAAVDYCHKRGVIHRDLKPSNIIVYPQGPVVKIIDFNLSHSPAYTAPPLPGGTIGFSAPEEFASNAAAAPSSDIWSIGKLMEMILPKGDRAWLRVVEKCLDPLPENRPSSASIIPIMLDEKKGVSMRIFSIVSILSILIVAASIFIFLNRPESGNSAIADLPPMIDNNTAVSLRNDTIAEGDDKVKVEEKGKAKAAVVAEVINQKDTVAIVKSKATEMAALRFKEQLAILDTATHQHTFALAKAGHWRWKANQDMEVWLKQQSLSVKERSRLRTISGLAIKDFEENHNSELKKAFHDAAYNRNVTSALEVVTQEENYIGGVNYIVKELDEDGEWRTYIKRKD